MFGFSPCVTCTTGASVVQQYSIKMLNLGANAGEFISAPKAFRHPLRPVAHPAARCYSLGRSAGAVMAIL